MFGYILMGLDSRLQVILNVIVEVYMAPVLITRVSIMLMSIYGPHLTMIQLEVNVCISGRAGAKEAGITMHIVEKPMAVLSVVSQNKQLL